MQTATYPTLQEQIASIARNPLPCTAACGSESVCRRRHPAAAEPGSQGQSAQAGARPGPAVHATRLTARLYHTEHSFAMRIAAPAVGMPPGPPPQQYANASNHRCPLATPRNPGTDTGDSRPAPCLHCIPSPMCRRPCLHNWCLLRMQRTTSTATAPPGGLLHRSAKGHMSTVVRCAVLPHPGLLYRTVLYCPLWASALHAIRWTAAEPATKAASLTFGTCGSTWAAWGHTPLPPIPGRALQQA